MKHMIRPMLVPVVALGFFAAACGDDDEAAPDDTSTTPTESAPSASAGVTGASGDITVFAAASLTDAFTELGEAFMAANPAAEVTFSFGASSDLVTQLNEGAPADVYASADQANMTKLIDADGTAGGPQVFATNSLAIIVEPDNPLEITRLADLENPDLIVVTCAPEVPIGAYSAEVFDNAGVAVEPDSFEEDVKAVANKVILGEADAGVVYTTDVVAAGDDATGVEIPADVNVTAEYPIAATAEAPNPDGAQAFVEYVVSDAGTEILESYGFSAP